VVKENVFISVPTALPHHHLHHPVTSTSGINASHLAAMAGSHTFAPVDHSAAFMMSNAAATIAAVAASAVQQMTQAKAPPGTAVTAAGGTSSALPPALYHAALQGNRNSSLLPAGSSSQVPPHTALLNALANAGAGQSSSVQSITSPPSVPGHVGASVSSLLRPNAPVLSQSTSTLASPALLSDMQSWCVERLDQHITLLHQMNQQVPHSVSILRSEAERKIKKKNDKRVANRKSASNSRARKKALVEEMTKTNARLKKQAMILALLPDLVITTTTEGEITFCSAQADRILQYQPDDLLGKKLYDLLVPSSRNALKSLIKELVHPGKAKMARASIVAEAHRGIKLTTTNQRNPSDANKNTEENINGNSNASARDSSRSGGNSTDDTSGAVAIVSEQSFPLSVVEVESKQQPQQLNQGAGAESSDNLDSSTSNGGSSEDDGGAATSDTKKKESNKAPARNDDYSPLSSETKNLRANYNLDRNVRWHNQRMLEGNNKSEADNGPKDDVTGASVTANNASARLSSLEHCPNAFRTNENEVPVPYESTGDQSSLDDSLLAGVEEKKKNEDASDDSGYRESNDSREESSSCWSDTSQSNDYRKKPLAPTCRMWLIRDDLTTVWCEVTSSIRNKSSDEDIGEDKPTNSKSTESSDVSGTNIDQELLLCLRPIRNGGKKVDESLRFVPLNEHQLSTTSPRDRTETWVSASSYSANTNKEKEGLSVRTVARNDSNNNLSSSLKQELNKKRPPKKRPIVTGDHSYSDIQTPKRPKHDSAASSSNTSETDVVESLMLMNKSSQ